MMAQQMAPSWTTCNTARCKVVDVYYLISLLVARVAVAVTAMPSDFLVSTRIMTAVTVPYTLTT
jgi:hypothetical protein